MQTHEHKDTQNKETQQTAASRVFGKHGSGPGQGLVDNRPEALVQQKLQAAADNGTQARNSSLFQAMADNRGNPGQLKPVVQLARIKTTKRRKAYKKRTISGHGALRRSASGTLVPYKVPKGRTIVITAPPGATLGDISLVLNITDNPNFQKIRRMVKISTNSDLWKNRNVIALVRANTKIAKTPKQIKLLEDLDTSVRSFDDLTGGEKGSLAALERKPEFEEWAESFVKPEMFRIKKGGEEINDMELTPFEDSLRSEDDETAKQNEYVENETFLSDYVDDNPDLTQITINACSYDPSAESDFTGFQIDKK